MVSIPRILILLLFINCIKIPPDSVPVVYIDKIGVDALATPWFILSRHRDKEVIDHEKCHVKQMNQYGSVWFFVVNGYYLYKYGYNNNPFEEEAYNSCIDDRHI